MKSTLVFRKNIKKISDIRNTLTRYINNLRRFKVGRLSKVTAIQGQDFTRKALEVAIQPGKATAQQWQQ